MTAIVCLHYDRPVSAKFSPLRPSARPAASGSGAGGAGGGGGGGVRLSGSGARAGLWSAWGPNCATNYGEFISDVEVLQERGCEASIPVGLLGHHHLHELLVVDLTVTVDIRLPARASSREQGSGTHVSWTKPALASLNARGNMPMNKAMSSCDAELAGSLATGTTAANEWHDRGASHAHGPDHLVNLLVCELLAEVGHNVAQLSGRDEAVAVLVEDLEGLRVATAHR